MPGVAAVYLEPSYTDPEEQQEQVAEPNMSTAVEMTGAGNVWAAGYTGAGSRIAIIDTGIAPDHQSFNEAAWIYALAKSAEFAGQSLESYMETLDLLDIAELQSVFDRLHVAENHPDLTAEDLYISGKLPFGYNYAEKSLSITHEDGVSEHGSHVAGIAGANRYVPTDEGYANAAEEVYVVGQAPDAQILTMRTFNSSGTCYASDYLAAIEDALILGCDAVNLSLGSGGPGYTIYGEEYFDGVFSTLAESDTVVSISAGNSYSWSTLGTAGAPGYNYVDDPNLDMVGSPGSMANAFTVQPAKTHR